MGMLLAKCKDIFCNEHIILGCNS